MAENEVDEAVSWYQEQNEDQGFNFLDELDRAVRLVTTCPLPAAEIELNVREFLFHNFPYSMIYGVDGETIVVIAVAHQHRQPRYWADLESG